MNGREAIERCKELDIDLVLMDLNMPGIDGLEGRPRSAAPFQPGDGGEVLGRRLQDAPAYQKY